MEEGRVMARSNKSRDEFFQDAFIKWAHSLLNNEKAKMIAFWSEYSELEKVLIQLKDNMNLLYEYFPQYYESLWQNSQGSRQKNIQTDARNLFKSSRTQSFKKSDC